MDGQTSTSSHGDPSRPSLGFPVGTALLLIAIFCLSGIMSCCYHWDKLRSMNRAVDADLEANAIRTMSKSVPNQMNSKEDHDQSLPVLMPGDRVPKFIAWPSPCEPLQPSDKITREVQVSSSLPS